MQCSVIHKYAFMSEYFWIFVSIYRGSDVLYCTLIDGDVFFCNRLWTRKQSRGYPLTLREVGSWRKLWWTFQLDWQLLKASPNVLEFRKMPGLQRSDIMAITWPWVFFSCRPHSKLHLESCMFTDAVRIRTRNRAMSSALLNNDTYRTG